MLQNLSSLPFRVSISGSGCFCARGVGPKRDIFLVRSVSRSVRRQSKEGAIEHPCWTAIMQEWQRYLSAFSMGFGLLTCTVSVLEGILHTASNSSWHMLSRHRDTVDCSTGLDPSVSNFPLLRSVGGKISPAFPRTAFEDSQVPHGTDYSSLP